MSTIEINSLTKRFGDVLAVDDLSFELSSGHVTGFLGPNGAGKTTTLRMLLGLVEPAGGTATFGGVRYRDLPDPIGTVGAVLESSSFHPSRTARSHLRVLAQAGRRSPRRADELLELVGLAGAADRRVGGFSLGMRQRLGLASALVGDPGVLILDEPTNGLDPWRALGYVISSTGSATKVAPSSCRATCWPRSRRRSTTWSSSTRAGW